MSYRNTKEKNIGERGRRPWSCCSHLRRKRRRYLVVPQAERDLLLLENAYCDNHDDVQKQRHRENDGGHRAYNRESFSSCDYTASSCRTSSRRSFPSTQETTSTRNVVSTSKRLPAANESLLLRTFYCSVGLKRCPSFTVTTTPAKNEESVRSDKKGTRQVIDDIDNPSLSTLTKGHHRRFLKLTTNSKHQQVSKLTFAHRKELGKLHDMVLNEQLLYRLALDKFHDCYKSRYLIGFESSFLDENRTNGKISANAFCRWACHRAKAINREWEKTIVVHTDSTDQQPSDDRNDASINTKSSDDDIHPLPKSYGKARQVIALHSSTQRYSLDIQDLTCSIVYESKPTPRPSSSIPAKIPEFSHRDIDNNRDGVTFRKIPSPTINSTPTVRLLRNDKKAMELAAKYSATIVTTSETLETLLQLPGDHSSKWILPCTTRKVVLSTSRPASMPSSSISVTILDLPIAQTFSSPRSCLELGLQEGLCQAFLKQNQPSQAGTGDNRNDKGEKDNTIPLASQVVYSLWTLPIENVAKNGSRKPLRVIIRSLVRLRDSVSKLPVRLRARVEYFHRPVNSECDTKGAGGNYSRREIPSSYEKSLLILDQVLFGHQVLCLQHRVDPTTCEIIGWDATSVAHAFAASSTPTAVAGAPSGSKAHRCPLDHWKALIQLLKSISSIDIPDTMLCLPGLIGGIQRTVNDLNNHIPSVGGAMSTVKTDCQTQHQQVRLDPFSVSVHAPGEDLFSSNTRLLQEPTMPRLFSSLPSSTGTITLDKSFLDQAGAVILGNQALKDCRRDWEWVRPGQVPYTFPVL